MSPLSFLSIRGLDVDYATRSARLSALRGIDLDVEHGQSLGLVGESGCGKSTLAAAILRLLPSNGLISSGEIRLDGTDLVGLGAEPMRLKRWKEIAYVPQNAATSLSPVATLFTQFIEAWSVHAKPDRPRLRERAEQLFRDVELSPRWLDAYPHQFSGGMRQRAIIALALLFEPALLVADEPTTGLDVIVQRQVLDVIKKVQRQHGTTLVFVSHDIGVIAELCSRLAVMYAGELVEFGATRAILTAPGHPYTIALKRAFPDIRHPEHELHSIPGQPPSLADPPRACVFAARCPFARERCRAEKPVPRAMPDGRRVACHFAEEAEAMRASIMSGTAVYPMEAA